MGNSVSIRRVDFRSISCVLLALILLGIGACASVKSMTGLSGWEAYQSGDYRAAYQEWLSSYEDRRAAGDERGMAVNAVNLADVSAVLKDVDAAERWARTAIGNINVASAKDPESYAEIGKKLKVAALGILSGASNDKNQYMEAIRYAQEGLALDREGSRPISRQFLYANLAEGYEGIGDVESAVRNYEKALAITTEEIESDPNVPKGATTSGPYEEAIADVRTKYQLAKGRRIPADLDIEVRFADDGSRERNQVLDSLEKAAIVVTLRNRGQGPAYGVSVVAEADREDVRVDVVEKVGVIRPGESKIVRIPVSSGIDLRDGLVAFSIQAREERGFDSRRVVVETRTVALSRPSLHVAENILIDDGQSGMASGNGDGQVGNGETAEITMFVENGGPGPAEAVVVVEDVSDGVQVPRRRVEIGTIPAGRTERAQIAVSIPRTFNYDDVRLTVRVEDVRGAGTSQPRTFAMRVDRARPMLTFERRIYDGGVVGSSGNQDGVVQNGETIVLEVVPRNEGRLEARNVALHADLPGGSLSFQQNSAAVGALPPGAEGYPARFVLSVPREYAEDTIPVSLELSQAEFPSNRERFDIPVGVRVPRLTFTTDVRDGNGNGVIEQGEGVDVSLRVENRGTLDAVGVFGTVSAPKEGITSKVRRVDLGTIPAGESRNASFGFFVSRRTDPGEWPVSVQLSQQGFGDVRKQLALEVREEQARVVVVEGEMSAPISEPQTSPRRGWNPPPAVLFLYPADGEVVSSPTVSLKVRVADDKALSDVIVEVNGERMQAAADRGIGMSSRPLHGEASMAAGQRNIELSRDVPLRSGRNRIAIIAFDSDNVQTREEIAVVRKVEAVGQGEYWALIIGIDQYKHWPRLNTPVHDAATLKSLLESHYGFRSDRIRYLRNREATRGGILDALDWLERSVGENDSVLIYYAGHGESDAVSGFWVPVDAREGRRAAYVSNSTIRDYMGALKAKHVYLVADSCFSGTLFASATRSRDASIPLDRYLEEMSSRRSRQVLTSGGDEPVSDGGKDGHSIFAYHFLRQLRENREPFITATNLFTQIARPITNNSNQSPIGSPLKDVGDEGGEFIFTLAPVK